MGCGRRPRWEWAADRAQATATLHAVIRRGVTREQLLAVPGVAALLGSETLDRLLPR